VVPSIKPKIRNPDRRVIRADQEADPPRYNPTRNWSRLGRIAFVVGCENRHVAPIPKSSAGIQLPDRKPNATHLIEAIRGLRSALRPLNPNPKRTRGGRVGSARERQRKAANHRYKPT
jgi:hypothetical protein